MSAEIEELKQYAAAVENVVLATVDGEGSPHLRTLGSFAVEDSLVYFSTPAKSAKVQRLLENQRVAVLFQREGQKIPAFVNLELRGRARVILDEAEFSRAAELIAGRSARFRERLAKGEVGPETLIVKITGEELRRVDLSRGAGSVSVFRL